MYKLIFIANSKQKKFKKLFLLSRILIKQYGFRYFFRIAFEEFFKQKRSLFTSDIMPKLDFKQFTTDYEIFKQKHMLTPLQVELIKKTCWKIL